MRQQQELIQNRIGIQPKVIEKVVTKEKIIYKNIKPKVNTYDDY